MQHEICHTDQFATICEPSLRSRNYQQTHQAISPDLENLEIHREKGEWFAEMVLGKTTVDTDLGVRLVWLDIYQ
ncbi:hypothetical protein HanIR_Chr16g0787401 [Helianthus annuus]|nr:hypothetical protein HanIR_Chr16g0787401 [Helianthus annuus]